MIRDLKDATYYHASTKVKKLWKEGRGQGEKESYLPWVKTHTHEFSSKGRATRIHGIKTNRIHHLQSDNQYRAFLSFEFTSSCIDIRESFPLIDVMEVIDEKDDLRFDRFTNKETNEPFVITTNFLLTFKDDDGSVRYLARTVKNISELNRKITWEKLEIERRYWLQKNIDWKIITNKQLPRQLAKNIEWVRESLLERKEALRNLDKIMPDFIDYLYQNIGQSLKKVLTAFDNSNQVAQGTAVFLFRYGIAKRLLQVDMTQKINLVLKVEDVIRVEV